MTYEDFVEQVLTALSLAPVVDDVLISVLHDQSFDWADRPPSDVVAEFGVSTGRTIRQICEVMPGHEVHGFDSFQGLPVIWRPGFDVGCFTTDGQVPLDLPSDVHLYEGLFVDTLPGFTDHMREHSHSMSLIHVDCDVYSSTQCVFQALSPFIHDTVVVFDELVDYPGFEDHELLAFYELLLDRPDVRWTCLASGGERGAFRLTETEV